MLYFEFCATHVWEKWTNFYNFLLFSIQAKLLYFHSRETGKSTEIVSWRNITLLLAFLVVVQLIHLSIMIKSCPSFRVFFMTTTAVVILSPVLLVVSSSSLFLFVICQSRFKSQLWFSYSAGNRRQHWRKLTAWFHLSYVGSRDALSHKISVAFSLFMAPCWYLCIDKFHQLFNNNNNSNRYEPQINRNLASSFQVVSNARQHNN